MKLTDERIKELRAANTYDMGSLGFARAIEAEVRAEVQRGAYANDAARLRFFRDLTTPERRRLFEAFGIDGAVLSEVRSLSDETRLFNHLFAAPQPPAKQEAQEPRKGWSAETVAMHFGNAPTLELIANVLNIAIADARRDAAPQPPAPCPAPLDESRYCPDCEAMQAKVAELEEANEHHRGLARVSRDAELNAVRIAAEQVAEIARLREEIQGSASMNGKLIDQLVEKDAIIAQQSPRIAELEQQCRTNFDLELDALSRKCDEKAALTGEHKDAARYRWLRDSRDSGACLRLLMEEPLDAPCDYDAAIDAAIAKDAP